MPNIKDIANSVKNSTPRRRKGRSKRTLDLAEPNFKNFAEYCRSKGKFPSDVLDDLIAMFLEEVKDDLPPDLSFDPNTEDGKKSA